MSMPAGTALPARSGLRRRGLRRGRPWLIGILILGLLLIAADRIGVIVAERAAAHKIQSAQHLSTTPSVSIRGVPFLTQLASSTLQEVDVSADDVVAGDTGSTIRIARLSAQLRHVHLTGFSSARAEDVTASALIDYRALSSRLGLPIRFGGPTADGAGRLQASQTVSVLGQQITGTASAEVAVGAPNSLRFVDPQLTAGSATVPSGALSALSSVFGAPIGLRRLPFSLTVQSIRATADGVLIVATARQVTYG